MAGLGIAVSIIFALILLIWVGTAFKRAKHKLLAFLMIGILLFIYFSATSVFKDQQIDLKSVVGITTAIKVYFTWVGSALGNVQTFTSNIIKSFTNNTK